MEISRVVDEGGLAQWHRVVADSFAVDFEAFPADPVVDMLPALTGQLEGEVVELWIGRVDGAVVGASTIHFPLRANVSVALGTVRVHPDHRSRGYGRELLDALAERCRAEGRRRVLFEVPSATLAHDPSTGEALAVAVGAHRLLMERRRLLVLTSTSVAMFMRQREEAAIKAAGYSTVTWRNETPAELVADMAELTGLMSTDPPQGDLNLEAQVWDDERYLDRERSIVSRGRQHLVVAVRHDASGRLVGFNDLGIAAGGPTGGPAVAAHQWDTVVHADHRGHRLGMLLKTTNLLELAAGFPDVRWLNTWNADDNTHMVAVNDVLGFQVMEGWGEWGLNL